ncbi:hypothetical protein EAS68_09930 [Legionella jordanis]|uniref:hypothetical protein n=1 Tax=Legionella jordanis TaxID=456 RepID=UPI000EFDD5DF|nr:hypothetical protein [Legionella jordanis]RMX17943.1 hypothetical protein EAS68_09930 [Legionella jordanis]
MLRLASFVLLSGLSFLSLAKACETKRELFIENSAAKVWKTTICPQQILPFHTHEYARVVIPEESGVLKVVYASGKEHTFKLKQKTPIFLSQAQGKDSHQDINVGSNVLHVIVVELRNQPDAK